MKSKATIKGHPIHPILVAFPIAFFIGALIFDILWAITGKPTFGSTARYLDIAGIIGGLLAAVPGFIDYLFTVPPRSSGKKRAAKHGLINVTEVIVFIIVLILRTTTNISVGWIIVLEALGVILLFIAGWMGGTLVYRNQIAVNPRYAHAGKWKELYVDKPEGPIKVAEVNELKVNQMKLVHVRNKRIVIGRTEEGYAAFDDHCTHKGGSLAGGSMICSTVQCPWHGSQFDVNSGMVKAGPAGEPIITYTIQETNGAVYLQL